MTKQTVKAISFIDSPSSKNIRKDIEKDPVAFLKKKLTLEGRFSFGVTNIMQSGVYKEMGYKYYLSPFLKQYAYKQYGSWSEAYALNKANLRKLVYGRITKIIEIN